jgi:hypothetical protein
MEGRGLTVGPLQENCFLAKADGAETCIVVDPGDEAERILGEVEQLGGRVEAILLTHTHFDHVGAVAELARATGAKVWCPELEVPILADINSYVFAGLRARTRATTPTRPSRAARRCSSAGLEIEVVFTPGHSPGHVTYAVPGRAGPVQRRRPLPGLGRAHRPARRRLADARAVDRHAARALPRRHDGPARAHGRHHARARARDEPLPHRAGAVLKAPRGTFDILPEQQAGRERVADAAKKVLEGAGYRRIETPTFESTELFSRGVGASTDIVQKEMYTFEDGGGRSITLRPEGTAPVARPTSSTGCTSSPSR